MYQWSDNARFYIYSKNIRTKHEVSFNTNERQHKLDAEYVLKDKKSAQEKERQKRIEEADAENVHSARNVEQENLKSILTPLELTIKEVS